MVWTQNNILFRRFVRAQGINAVLWFAFLFQFCWHYCANHTRTSLCQQQQNYLLDRDDDRIGLSAYFSNNTCHRIYNKL